MPGTVRRRKRKKPKRFLCRYDFETYAKNETEARTQFRNAIEAARYNLSTLIREMVVFEIPEEEED